MTTPNDEMIYEIKSRVYHFQFYKEYFICRYKLNFRKHQEMIFYKEVKEIVFLPMQIKFVPYDRYTIYFQSTKRPISDTKKPLDLWCNTKKNALLYKKQCDSSMK